MILDQFGNRIISPTPATGGYVPSPRHIWGTQPRDLPLFTFLTIRYMIVDPTIRLGLAMRMAPLAGIKFGYKKAGQFIEGVECKNPEVKEFLDRQVKRIWKTSIEKMCADQIWGWSAGELMYRIKNNKVQFDTLIDRHATDTRALMRNHRLCGVQFHNTAKTGEVRLGLDGKAWWSAFRPEANRFYGDSILKGAYSPFADKWFDGGALDSARLFMHADAYAGRSIGYPPGFTNVDGEDIPNRDIAREMEEQMKTGAVISYPLIYDERGNEMWKINPVQMADNPSHILQYPKDLDVQMLRGMEIPDDVLTAEATGSWQGKRVPMQAFYSGLNIWASCLVASVQSYILEPLVWWNWRKVVDFDLGFMPLDEQAMEQFQQGGPQGGAPAAGGAPGSSPGALGPSPQPAVGGPPPEGDAAAAGAFGGGGPVSLDLTAAVGRGVLDAGKLVRAARKVTRQRMRARRNAARRMGWITIGGYEADGKKHVDGTPVHVENGTITKGPDGLTGRKISDVDQNKNGKHPKEKKGGKQDHGKQGHGENGKHKHGHAPSVQRELMEVVRDASELDIEVEPLVELPEGHGDKIEHDDDPRTNWAGKYKVGKERFTTKQAAKDFIAAKKKQSKGGQQQPAPAPDKFQEAVNEYRDGGTPHATAAKELIAKHLKGSSDKADKAREGAWIQFFGAMRSGALKVDANGVLYAETNGEKRGVKVKPNGALAYSDEPYSEYRRKVLFNRTRASHVNVAKPVSAADATNRRRHGLPSPNSPMGRALEQAVGGNLEDQAAFQGIVNDVWNRAIESGIKVPRHDHRIIAEALKVVDAFGGVGSLPKQLIKQRMAVQTFPNEAQVHWPKQRMGEGGGDARFDESKHPRKSDGKFTHKGGGESKRPTASAFPFMEEEDDPPARRKQAWLPKMKDPDRKISDNRVSSSMPGRQAAPPAELHNSWRSLRGGDVEVYIQSKLHRRGDGEVEEVYRYRVQIERNRNSSTAETGRWHRNRKVAEQEAWRYSKSHPDLREDTLVRNTGPYEWDGVIHDEHIDYDSIDSSSVSSWNSYPGDYDDDGEPVAVDHYVEIEEAEYDDGVHEPFTVYRWQSIVPDDGDVDDTGEWTDDYDEARQDARDYARRMDEERPDSLDYDGEYDDGEYDDDDYEPTPPPKIDDSERIRLGKHKGTTRVGAGLSQETVDKALKTLFPNSKEPMKDLASCAGATDDAEVVVASARRDSITVQVRHDNIRSCTRTFGIDARGRRYIHNDYLSMVQKGGGMGTQMLAREVENAAEQGFDYIETHAAGGSMNGYYTWPRLGYDQTIKSISKDHNRLAQRIRQEFPNAHSVRDIMVTEEGRDWWKNNGGDLFHARFDLREGSWSRYTLDKYVAAKLKGKVPSEPQQAAGSGEVAGEGRPAIKPGSGDSQQ